ncbi:transmembrane transporter [Malassezia pachydermatis]|uniref:Spermine transporter n=1 Tax=Malassezia pachydermatis TaxID=77020 RepID=A0A0M8MUZ4_9BASI|nr:spermine transporter [Malassezia pachydermatis]KOS14131.1 spermine transporter [Malassezia pachydermatis]
MSRRSSQAAYLKESLHPELSHNHHHHSLTGEGPFPEQVFAPHLVDDDLEVSSTTSTKEEENDPFLVHFKEGDKANPKNFSKRRKWVITVFTSVLCFAVSVGSSMPTSDLRGAAKSLDVGNVPINLSIALFVAGFGFGPLFFAPLSEIFGRWVIYVISGFLYFIFTLPCALAPNLATLLASRMISGLAASVPMTNVGGSLSDIWRPEDKGLPMAIFSSILFIGPAAGPLVGGAIASATNLGKGWRYIYWTLFAFIGIVWVASLFTEETLAPVILKKRAKKLRKETGDKRYQTAQERDPMALSKVLAISLLRPLEMLVMEPILIAFSLYLCLVYALLYMMFFAYPIIFEEGHGFNALQVGLCFISLIIGICASIVFVWVVIEPITKRRIAKRGYAVPEDRLILMFVGAISLPISLFILAWTSMPSVHWAGALVAGLPTGASFVMLYISANSYLVDCYPKVAASALAAKTLLRSLCGAAVPLFIYQMMHAMHNQWALTLLALVSVLMAPIPFFFYKYGPEMRKKSRFATGDDE